MGIPLWREPTEAETAKSALDKDSSAAARSSIRRQSAIRRPRHPNARARGANVLSSFHSQILDEIQRGISEPQSGVRSPVMNFGVSEDGVDLDASRREALGRTTTRPSTHRPDFSSRRARNTTRDQALFDILRDPPPRSQSYSSPSLTPNFAPAAASHSASSPQPPEVLRIRGSDIVPSIYAENRSRDNTESRPPFPLLRNFIRNHNRSRDEHTRAEAPRPSIDGLGDRQRSPSPDSERQIDAWETLLSTLTPDTNLPSTDSSFSSTFTSAADTLRNGGSASRGTNSLPHLRWQSNGLTPNQLALDPTSDQFNPCDFSSDDEDAPPNYGQILATQPVSLRRPPGLNSTLSSHPPIPTISLSFSSLDSGDTDLQQMQAILDRLARREDIPDDWWAGAGLSRNMGRGLSATAPTRANENENSG